MSQIDPGFLAKAAMMGSEAISQVGPQYGQVADRKAQLTAAQMQETGAAMRGRQSAQASLDENKARLTAELMSNMMALTHDSYWKSLKYRDEQNRRKAAAGTIQEIEKQFNTVPDLTREAFTAEPFDLSAYDY